MCYFLINILKITVSAIGALSSFFRLQHLYFCAEISLYYSAIYVSGGARFSFVPRHNTLTVILTVLVFERCSIIEFSKPSFIPADYLSIKKR